MILADAQTALKLAGERVKSDRQTPASPPAHSKPGGRFEHARAPPRALDVLRQHKVLHAHHRRRKRRARGIGPVDFGGFRGAGGAARPIVGTADLRTRATHLDSADIKGIVNHGKKKSQKLSPFANSDERWAPAKSNSKARARQTQITAALTVAVVSSPVSCRQSWGIPMRTGGPPPSRRRQKCGRMR